MNSILSNIKTLISSEGYKARPISIMLWGAPGIGKSSIVRKLASDLNLLLVDVRLSQLAPTDLRGLPIIDNSERMKWATPNFLPRIDSPPGILFLDEFNMCSGAMMGIAQQLVLDRHVGDYRLPDNWVIIAAGNRAQDRAAISVMPAPVANRFIHFHMEPSLDEFKNVVYTTFNHISDETKGKVLGFLNFKPDLLNAAKLATTDIQFPTPRSWESAMQLLDVNIDPSSAIGDSTAIQLKAYLKLTTNLPDLDKILLHGTDSKVSLNKQCDPSIHYAIVSSLISKSSQPSHYSNSFFWLQQQDFTEDYLGLFISESLNKLKSLNISPNDFIQALCSNPLGRNFVSSYRDLIVSFTG